MALGELRDIESLDYLESLGNVNFAKLGMAGLARDADWPKRWGDASRRLAPGVSPVAVVYADWAAVAAPEPAQVLIEAKRLGCAAVLVDTHDKSAGHLLDWWDLGSLANYTASVQRHGMLAVLAGSLTMETAGTVASLNQITSPFAGRCATGAATDHWSKAGSGAWRGCSPKSRPSRSRHLLDVFA